MTVCAQVPAAVFVVMFPGHAMLGGTVSLTVTVKLQVAVLPLASAAVQVTGVAPLRKVEPLGGAQVTVTPEQSSLAVAA
jgi:hypothetical protein